MGKDSHLGVCEGSSWVESGGSAPGRTNNIVSMELCQLRSESVKVVGILRGQGVCVCSHVKGCWGLCGEGCWGPPDFFFSGVMSWPRGSLLAPVCLRYPHVVITLVSECVPMGQPWAWVLEVGACGVTTTLGSGALARL